MYNNSITIIFKEDQGKSFLNKVLQYTRFSEKLYYYIVFGDSLGGCEYPEYYELYSELNREEGRILLRPEDMNNIDFIYSMLNNYHSSCLYITEDSLFLERYPDITWRDNQKILQKGYTIEMLADYITILRGDEQPPFNLDEVGITEDCILKNKFKEKRSLLPGDHTSKILLILCFFYLLFKFLFLS